MASAFFAHRNFAERARGLSIFSLNVGRTGSSLISAYAPLRCPSLNAALTSRSSPLWKLMIAARPPGRRHHGKHAQQFLQVGQLAVHQDAQGLKDRAVGRICCWRTVGSPFRGCGLTATGAASRIRSASSCVRSSGRVVPPPDDRRGDLVGFRLVAQLAEGCGQVVRGQRVEQFGGGPAASGVHAHVERAVAREREPALGVVDLHARHAQVGEQAVAAVEACSGQSGGKPGEVAVMQGERRSDRGQLFACRGEVARVEVERDELASRSDAAQ